jgi:hypothetical protein
LSIISTGGLTLFSAWTKKSIVLHRRIGTSKEQAESSRARSMNLSQLVAGGLLYSINHPHYKPNSMATYYYNKEQNPPGSKIHPAAYIRYRIHARI